MIAGADLTVPIAYRWKTQINENAGVPAFCGELPELDHNEIAGWLGRRHARRRFSAVFLDDRDSHPRLRTRIELTERLIRPHAALTRVVETRGESALERVCSLVLLGDLVSVLPGRAGRRRPDRGAAARRLKELLAARE